MAVLDLPARPEPLAVDPARTALVVNDMQNAFCSPGGYIDRIGFDLSGAPAVVDRVAALAAAARRAGVATVFMQNGFSADLHEAPGPASPLWHKSNALRYMRAHLEAAGRILVRGTWDHDFVDGLQPEPGDRVVQKPTDDGFAGTELDHLLRAADVNTILVCGISTNVGVESTLRAGYHRGYFGVLIADACMAVGPPFMQAATEFSIATFFGWVSSVEEVLGTLAASR
jgi:ureidoacrylate peracid hydrolase